MKEVYLIRHGEATLNVEKKFCGWNECPLTEKGQNQAKSMAEEVKKLGIQKIYASPLKRAYDTAKAISDRVITDEGLKELNFGDFDSMPFEEVWKNHTELANEMLEANFDFSYPNGENRLDFFERVNNTYSKIIENDNADKIIIVAHSCVIRAIISNLLCGGSDLYFKLHLGNVGISKVVHYEDKKAKPLTVEFINRELKLK